MQPLESKAGAPESKLPEDLLEQVLKRLNFTARPEPTLAGLRLLYAAWSHRVPFDNVRKLIHVRTGKAGALPGGDAPEFFETWLRHGTGGTCWSVAGALHALLYTLGFDAERGVATMLAAPNLPPNHGTVQVLFDGARYLVDGALLCGEPLLLSEKHPTGVENPAWGVRCERGNGAWLIDWRPLHKLDGFQCRLERFGASATEYAEFYEKTRGWSPFNYQVSARLNRGDEVVGLGFGRAVTLHADGSATQQEVTHQERQRVLVEKLGMSEEIVSQLPEDIPTPPPPGSQAARDAGLV